MRSIDAQHRYGRKNRQTDYAAFSKSLSSLMSYIGPSADLYIPYGIGCGLGGGSWDAIEMIIAAVAPNAILVKL